MFWVVDEDYPRTLLELEKRFSSEEACAGYLAALRWPAGWICPRLSRQEAVALVPATFQTPLPMQF